MALCFREKRVVFTIFDYTIKYFSTRKINGNLYLLSNDGPNVNLQTFKVNINNTKPIAVMPVWLMAPDKYIAKYAKFYSDYGFDVLCVKLKLWQLLWPPKGTQVVAANILKFLEINEKYSPIVLHGFSIGGYLWGEALVHMENDKKRYQSIVDRTKGQIWDSLADITRIPIGAPKATFPNSKFLETALRSYILFHMKVFDKVATCHYWKSRAAFYDNLIRTPMLLIGSKIDPIASEDTLIMLGKHWEKVGIKVYWQIWDDSPHVSHMFKHPKEYIEVMTKYLEDVKAIEPKK